MSELVGTISALGRFPVKSMLGERPGRAGWVVLGSLPRIGPDDVHREPFERDQARQPVRRPWAGVYAVVGSTGTIRAGDTVVIG